MDTDKWNIKMSFIIENIGNLVKITELNGSMKHQFGSITCVQNCPYVQNL